MLIQIRLPYIETTCHLNPSSLIHILSEAKGIAPGAHTPASITKVFHLTALAHYSMKGFWIDLAPSYNSPKKMNHVDAEQLNINKKQFTPWQRQIGQWE